MAKKAEQTTEIAVVENTKLTELAQKSGIELTKAEAGKRMEANVKEALAIVKKVIIEDSKTLL